MGDTQNASIPKHYFTVEHDYKPCVIALRNAQT